MFWWDHLSRHMDFYSEDSVSSLCQGVGPGPTWPLQGCRSPIKADSSCGWTQVG